MVDVRTKNAASASSNGGFLTRRELRTLLTILMYAGVALFFIPFFWGHEHHALRVQAAGALAAVVFGLSRCFFTEEDCWGHVSR